MTHSPTLVFVAVHMFVCADEVSFLSSLSASFRLTLPLLSSSLSPPFLLSLTPSPGSYHYADRHRSSSFIFKEFEQVAQRDEEKRRKWYVMCIVCSVVCQLRCLHICPVPFPSIRLSFLLVFYGSLSFSELCNESILPYDDKIFVNIYLTCYVCGSSERGITLISVPESWNFSEDSIAATIRKLRCVCLCPLCLLFLFHIILALMFCSVCSHSFFATLCLMCSIYRHFAYRLLYFRLGLILESVRKTHMQRV